MTVTMNQVSAIMEFFQALQQKYNYSESGNVLHYKWDMRAVANQIADSNELRMLIEFFMLFSDDRSFDYFFRYYHEYYDKMKQVQEDRLRRAYLQKKTIEAVKEKRGPEEVES